MKYIYLGLRKFLFKIKRKIQLWFRFGVHYHRRLTFEGYVSRIANSCKEGKTDFQLLTEFSTFCKQKRFVGEAIEFLERQKEVVREKTILNFFLLQNYIIHNRRLFIQHKNAGVIKENAKAIIEETLVASFGQDYMSQISATLPHERSSIRSNILLMDVGWENFGFIEHLSESDTDSYLTKVGISLQENNEIKFYRSVPKLYPALRPILPAVTDIRISDDSLISLLTMQKAPGVAANKQQFESLIELHLEYIQKCNYDPVKSPALIREFEIGYSHLFLSKSFSHIHHKKGFSKIEKWVKKALRDAAYDPKIKQTVKALGKQLKKIKLYEHVLPERHFSLCHGDYNLSNVLYDERTERFTIIDWTQCTYGPRLLDIAGLLRNQREHICSFREIEEMVLHRIDKAKKYDEIDKLLFIYASIVVSLLFERASIIKEDPNYFFLPAVEKCEELIAAIVAGEPLTRARESSSKE